ncbi:hypothetical protein CH275_16570 [Rhodococcus sp. 06-235-1A]|uniref:hypothetical protein n=1 Tax=Rhodococcus sp. 06-235-1A TaxID=2022508 RepID=UPI000B9AA0DB|nr:hypothetical protein [Rhodococcus sp. 06-235-1A]OZD03391.1 hypothetical protein CH275_16570 [Rhodococcus sp. 06-235-1A]
MSENESVDVAAIPDRVLDDLAEVLIDGLDQLLDRLTDRAFDAPTPGSAVWELEWSDRESAIGQARAFERNWCGEQVPASGWWPPLPLHHC